MTGEAATLRILRWILRSFSCRLGGARRSRPRSTATMGRNPQASLEGRQLPLARIQNWLLRRKITRLHGGVSLWDLGGEVWHQTIHPAHAIGEWRSPPGSVPARAPES